MKPRSLLAPLIALAAVLSLVLTSAPATAQAAPAAAALPRHSVKYDGKEIRNSGKFTTWGTVYTGTRGQRIYLQSKRGRADWRVAQVKRLPGSGAFRFNFDGPVGTCYRLKINRGHGHRLWVGRVGCIVRR